jgi:uncharacterized protein (TIGR02217 family)
MTITIFADVILKNQWVEGGIKGRSVRKNQRVTSASGIEAINIVQDKTRREYDIGIAPLRRATWQQLEALFEVTEGGAYGFLLQDPKDSTAAITEGVVAGPITGSPGWFQMFKRYTEPVSGRYKDRKITRPYGPLQVLVSGVSHTYTVDTTNGRINVAGVTDPSTITWSGSFYVPVHFLNDQIDWELVVWGQDPDGRFATGPMVTLEEILGDGLPVV